MVLEGEILNYSLYQDLESVDVSSCYFFCCEKISLLKIIYINMTRIYKMEVSLTLSFKGIKSTVIYPLKLPC